MKFKTIVIRQTVNGCQECISHTKNRGYTQLRLDGKLQKLHRAIYMLVHGKISSTVVVRHKCDNPSCVNIEHLEAGTQLDNIQDTVNRGRLNQGDDHKDAKLNSSQIPTIRSLKGNKTAQEVADLYKVNSQTIRDVWNRITWKHVT